MFRTWWNQLTKGPRVSDLGLVARSGSTRLIRPHPIFAVFEFTSYLGLIPALFLYPPIFLLQAINIAGSIAIERGSLIQARLTVWVIDFLAVIGFTWALIENDYHLGLAYLVLTFSILFISGSISIQYRVNHVKN